jgi:hypothetical protein
MLPNQNRFKAGALVAGWLACAACSSAFAEDVAESAGTAQNEDKPPLVTYPIGLQTNRSVFARMLQPLPSRSPLSAGKPRKVVIGDIDANGEPLTWRLGSWVVRPTASYEPLAAATWTAGVASVAVAVEGVRMYGALASERCLLAGEVDRGTANGFLIQPFVNYNLSDGWYLTSVPVISADWKAPSGRKWTVPLGAGIGRFVRRGQMPLSVQAGYYYNIEKPDGAADWALRLQLRLLFPG